MKVVLGCDPLLAQLTGIGNYTQQLGAGLLNSSRIEILELFAHGKYYGHELLMEPENSEKPKKVNGTLWAALRSNLANSTLAVSLYSKLIPIIEKRALRTKDDYIFHSPNFLLPNHGGKRVVTIHDLSTMVHPEFHPSSRVKLVNNAIEQSVKYADHIITDSKFIKNQLCESFALSSDKVSAIHLGVSEQYFPRSEEQCTPFLYDYGLVYKQFLLFVSTIEPRKNVLRLLQAFQLYREKNKNGLPLILIGGLGWNNEKEHNKIRELEGKGWVRYLGYVKQRDIPFLYAASKGVVFPSLYEGFGLPVAEAMQSGVSVLVSENSSMSEFSGESAYLVDPLDVDSIRSAIEELTFSELTPKSMSFSWENTVRATIESYSR
ncbi:glycosyltransferase family 4 protein [Pseudoalteromonas piratica]|uniref:Glycosyl transferase family 1 n=1 Tax=Pseudoalteromonas piratica TaxID=1348114 RepID=A0A0A7EF55_9GAMM|nr:glycosyltransferase family 1 protein [Pseudoalteromonas piratica]AIY64607.1 hypothetical protein OM33_05170 [Pseudoalteromonas piratica]